MIRGISGVRKKLSTKDFCGMLIRSNASCDIDGFSLCDASPFDQCCGTYIRGDQVQDHLFKRLGWTFKIMSFCSICIPH